MRERSPRDSTKGQDVGKYKKRAKKISFLLKIMNFMNTYLYKMINNSSF
jgi:hypothetical protein